LFQFLASCYPSARGEFKIKLGDPFALHIYSRSPLMGVTILLDESTVHMSNAHTLSNLHRFSNFGFHPVAPIPLGVVNPGDVCEHVVLRISLHSTPMLSTLHICFS